MINKSSAEYILMKITELDALEFLGICKIIGVSIYEQHNGKIEEASEEGGQPKCDVIVNVRPFEDIWCDVCDTIENMNRTKRRNLNKLVRAATKKEK